MKAGRQWPRQWMHVRMRVREKPVIGWLARVAAALDAVGGGGDGTRDARVVHDARALRRLAAAGGALIQAVVRNAVLRARHCRRAAAQRLRLQCTGSVLYEYSAHAVQFERLDFLDNG